MYKIIDIKDEYILSKENDKMVKIYIYQVDPIQIINMSDDSKRNILNSYVTFLREININFQVLLINKKLNLQNVLNKVNNFESMYSEYFNDMKSKLQDDCIYYTDYYIIISISKNDKIEDIDKTINILKNCGCNISRLTGKLNIEKILYECINKEEINEK